MADEPNEAAPGLRRKLVHTPSSVRVVAREQDWDRAAAAVRSSIDAIGDTDASEDFRLRVFVATLEGMVDLAVGRAREVRAWRARVFR